MLDAGIIDETGAILETSHRFTASITQINGESAFVLPGTQVSITQGDIRNIQLSKAAICAGLQTLMSHTGLCGEDIGGLVIAGGFGGSLDLNAAEKIGLIPPGFAGKTVTAGNAALHGAARLAAVGSSAAQELSRKCSTLELSANADFFDKYISNMGFIV